MAISFNTSATVDNNGSASTTLAITVPAGVLANDVVIICVSVIQTSSTTIPTLSVSSTGTTPSVAPGTNNPATGSESLPAAVAGEIYYFIATASDAGKVITFTSSISAFMAIALVAYTGANTSSPIDVLKGVFGGANTDTVTTPTISTVTAGDWALNIAGGAGEGGGWPGSPTGTQRANDYSSSLVAASIYDSNGSVGAAGTSIGNDTFNSNTPSNSILFAFTLGLAPPSSGSTPVPQQAGSRFWQSQWRKTQAIPQMPNPAPTISGIPQPGSQAWQSQARKKQTIPTPPPSPTVVIAALPPAAMRSRSSSTSIIGLRAQRQTQMPSAVQQLIGPMRSALRPVADIRHSRQQAQVPPAIQQLIGPMRPQPRLADIRHSRPQPQMPIGAPRVPIEQKQGQRARYLFGVQMRRPQTMPIGAPRVPIEQQQGQRKSFPFGIQMRRPQTLPIGAPRVPIYQPQGQRRRILAGLRSQRQQGLTTSAAVPVQGSRNRMRLAGLRTRPQTGLVQVQVVVVPPTPPQSQRLRARIVSWRTRPQSQVAPAAVVLVAPVVQTQAGNRARLLALRTRNVRAIPPAVTQVPAPAGQRARYRAAGRLQRRQAGLGMPGAAVPLVQPRPVRGQAPRRQQKPVQVVPAAAVAAPKASVRTSLQRFVGWVRRRPATAVPLQAQGIQTRFGTAALSASTVLAVTATSRIDLANLWAVYLNAKQVADAATQLYIEARMAGGYAVGTLYFGDAYQKQLVAGIAYETWYAAWRRVNPAPPSGPPQAPPDFPTFP